MRTLNVAVIGVGYMGTRHAVKYRGLGDVKLVAIVDERPTRATEIANELGCQAFTSIDDLLASGVHIDAATVATTTVSHYTIASRLLEAGVHCLVEKPLAATSAEAKKLALAARNTAHVLMPGHIERFNPAVRAVRDRSPDIRYITAYRVGPLSFRSIDTDVVLDVMSHDIDIVYYLTGHTAATVSVVRAFASPEGINDIAKVEIRIGRCIVDLVASRLAIARRRKMRIYAADGYYSIDCARRTAVHLDRERYREGLKELRLFQEMGREIPSEAIFTAVGAEHIVDPHRHGGDPLAEEIKCFLAKIRGDVDDPIVTPDDGVAVVEMAEHILALCTDWETLTASETFRSGT
jgi:predicted dehydrogenase